MYGERNQETMVGKRTLGSVAVASPRHVFKVLGGANKGANPPSPNKSPTQRKFGVKGASKMDSIIGKLLSKTGTPSDTSPKNRHVLNIKDQNNRPRSKSMAMAGKMGGAFMARAFAQQLKKTYAISKRGAGVDRSEMKSFQNSILGVEDAIEKKRKASPRRNRFINQRKEAKPMMINQRKTATPLSPGLAKPGRGNQLVAKMDGSPGNSPRYSPRSPRSISPSPRSPRSPRVEMGTANMMSPQSRELKLRLVKYRDRCKKLVLDIKKQKTHIDRFRKTSKEKLGNLEEIIMGLRKTLEEKKRAAGGVGKDEAANIQMEIMSLKKQIERKNELTGKMKKVFESKMKELGKKCISYEDVIKSIKKKALEMKKQNYLLAKENKTVIEQIKGRSGEYNMLVKRVDDMKKKLKFIKMNCGPTLQKLGIDLNGY